LEETNNTAPVANETPVESYSSQGAEAAPVDQTQNIGVQEIIVGSEITDKDRDILYERLGRPKDHEGYDLSGIVPETYNQGVVDEFKKKAHETGMSAEGVRKMAEWYKELEIKQRDSIEKSKMIQADQHILELKKDFGVNFDTEVKNARKALDAYTDSAFRKYMDDTGLGNHPALVKAFAKIGRELSEDKLVQSDTAVRLAKSEDLKRSEIARLRSDKDFMSRYRRGEAAAAQRLNALYID
jgi:DNA-binding transcriptional MerR regulator